MRESLECRVCPIQQTPRIVTSNNSRTRPIAMNAHSKFSSSLLGLTLSFVMLTGAGCQSSGGSKWTWWNPMSRSTADTALAASEAPKLPSDSATPVIEGTESLGGPAKSSTAIASNEAPSFQPSTSTSSPEATPGAEAAKIASTPSLPAGSTPTAPSGAVTPFQSKSNTTVASATPALPKGNPYDPGAYKEPVVAKVASKAPKADRYGSSGSRYGASNTPAFDSLPPVKVPPATKSNRYGEDRYATAPATNQLPPIEPVTAPTTRPAAPVAAASPYNSLPPASSLPPQNVASGSNSKPVALPSINNGPTKSPALPQIAALPKPPAEPALPGKPAVESPTIGTLPASSVYAASVPAQQSTQPVQQASGDGTGQTVRIATRPGEYRPGGTSSYQTGTTGSTLLK